MSRFREDVIAGDLISFGGHVQIVVTPGSVASDRVLMKAGGLFRFAGALIVNHCHSNVFLGTAYATSRTLWSCDAF